ATLTFPGTANSPKYLNIVLDTASLPDADTNYPSWGTVTVHYVDLTAEVDKPNVHPTLAPDLHLKHIFSKEQLTVPVKVTNAGFENASTNISIAFSLSLTSTYDPSTAVAITSGNISSQAIKLDAFTDQTFMANLTIPTNVPFHAGDKIYVLAKLT